MNIYFSIRKFSRKEVHIIIKQINIEICEGAIGRRIWNIWKKTEKEQVIE